MQRRRTSTSCPWHQNCWTCVEPCSVNYRSEQVIVSLDVSFAISEKVNFATHVPQGFREGDKSHPYVLTTSLNLSYPQVCINYRLWTSFWIKKMWNYQLSCRPVVAGIVCLRGSIFSWELTHIYRSGTLYSCRVTDKRSIKYLLNYSKILFYSSVPSWVGVQEDTKAKCWRIDKRFFSTRQSAIIKRRNRETLSTCTSSVLLFFHLSASGFCLFLFRPEE